jgi:hypothetical protein
MDLFGWYRVLAWLALEFCSNKYNCWTNNHYLNLTYACMGHFIPQNMFLWYIFTWYLPPSSTTLYMEGKFCRCFPVWNKEDHEQKICSCRSSIHWNLLTAYSHLQQKKLLPAIRSLKEIFRIYTEMKTL